MSTIIIGLDIAKSQPSQQVWQGKKKMAGLDDYYRSTLLESGIKMC